jgi:uracil-DNA glycosylase
MEKRIDLPECWLNALQDEFQKEYMKNLKSFLADELNNKKIIYPKGEHIFQAFKETPLDKVRVVIIGQDPYHGPNQAHGMCFSVLPGIKPPPSLLNIYKELQDDLGITPPNHGYLLPWAQQGVFLLNSTLTVEAHKAASHQGRGWETFTDKVIEILNQQDRKLIFLLWGSPAQKKARLVDPNKHYLLKSVHPSPLSAYRGFLGCKHFSQANNLLSKMGEAPINWALN